jgi:hypothetical protein
MLVGADRIDDIEDETVHTFTASSWTVDESDQGAVVGRGL